MSLGEYKPEGSALPPTRESLRAVRPTLRLGQYELQKLLGEGSMGQVYLARHLSLGRQVALKVLRPELARQSDQVARFFQEARAVNQINHKNIVQIIDFVQESSTDPAQPAPVYCVMELLSGKSLAEWFRGGGLGIAGLIEVARQVCGALQAAHGAGIVHRDIKPDNIMVEQQDDRFVAKVVDFGVAKLLLPEARVLDSTSKGSMIGTPLYMAPEQAACEVVDHRADIYALGSVLYEGLAGHPPFQSASLGGLFAQVIRDRAPPLPATTPWDEVIPLDLAALVESCLAKEPEARPQSMDALSQLVQRAVANALPQPTSPLSHTLVASARPALPPPPRSFPWVPTAVAVALVVGGGSLWALLRPGSTTTPPSPPAPTLPPVVSAPTPAPPVPSPAIESAAVVAPPAPPSPTSPDEAPAPTVATGTLDRTKRAGGTDAPVGAPGELAVIAVRAGRPFFATVFVDGTRLGNSPLQRALPPGHHRVHLARDGVPSEDREVTIRSGETSRLRVEMTP